MIPASSSQCDSFKHIENLKEGERLRYKGGPQKNPKKDEEVTVYRVFSSKIENEKGKDGAQMFRFDFSTIFEQSSDNGNFLLEYIQDSRYYERVANE